MKNSLITFKNTLIFSAALVLAGSAFSLVSDRPVEASEQVESSQPPAATVTVQTIQAKPVRIWARYSGRLQAVDYVEVKPQVEGRITDIRFSDGQLVKKGHVLYVIEPGPYEAAFARAQANTKLAGLELERAAKLVKDHAIAQTVYDQRLTAKQIADAELKQAEIDLDHAYVKAPISGRVGRREMTLGNLVQSMPETPVLTTIVSNDGIYADFEVDEQTYLRSVHQLSAGNREGPVVPVEMQMNNDGKQVYHGKIHAFDNHIDTATGTIRARARFDNADGTLIPGMFVSIRLAGGLEDKAILVSERAIGTDQDKKFVYVVDKTNKAQYRLVTLGELVESQRVVLNGLADGDRVIVDGIQHVQPGAPVNPQEIQTPPSQKTASNI